MSFLLDSNGMKITSATNKVLFDSARKSPHIVAAIQYTLNSNGNLTGWQGKIDREVGHQYVEVVQEWSGDYTGDLFRADSTFIIPYYRVSLPVTNTIAGVYPVGETNGNWIAANGGLLLRVFSSNNNFAWAGGLQGTQHVHAYIPSPGTLRLSVLTNIFGHVRYSDSIYVSSNFATERVIPNTAFVVDFKIFIGTI